MGATTDDRLLNSREAARYLGLEPGTLSIWRCTKRYPLSYVKIGRKVMYRKSDVDAFIEARTVRLTTFTTDCTE
jgi:excisionase family DNA binding protein